MNKGVAVGPSAAAVGESGPKFDDGCVPDKEKVLETGCTKTTTERIGGPLSCGNNICLPFDSVRHRLYVKI